MSGGRNTGGRARVARRRAAIHRQLSNEGLKVVTWNCQGLTMFKLFLLFEITTAQVICLQETWLPKGGGMPDIPGFHVFEHRRAKGKRGGFATLVKKGINVTRVVDNEYALLTDLLLPGGARVAVVNTYMPPIASIKRKRLNDEMVQDAVSALVTRVPHDM
jgi:exonuclease III